MDGDELLGDAGRKLELGDGVVLVALGWVQGRRRMSRGSGVVWVEDLVTAVVDVDLQGLDGAALFEGKSDARGLPPLDSALPEGFRGAISESLEHRFVGAHTHLRHSMLGSGWGRK